MPDKLREVAINNASEFSLTGSSPPRQEGSQFVHEREVQKWLDLLRGQQTSPACGPTSPTTSARRCPEDTNLLRALQHTVWYMPSASVVPRP